ncbi:unnamed protein product [Cunninghamella blakesleeana]
MSLFTFLLSLTFINIVLAIESEPNSGSFQIPIWAIAIVGVVIALLLIILGYFIIRRYSSKKQTVDTFNELEKRPSTTTQSDDSTETIGSFSKVTNSVYKPAMIDQEKLNLPLPPPSTSLFSDKMELNSDDAMKLFEQYVQADRNNNNNNKLQQKMGTIRSTLKQSLRRQKSKSRKPDVNQMFDQSNSSITNTSQQKRSSTDLPRTSISTMSQHTSTTLQNSVPYLSSSSQLQSHPFDTKLMKSSNSLNDDNDHHHHDKSILPNNSNNDHTNDPLTISVSSPLTPSPSPPVPSTPSPPLPALINPSEKDITDSDPNPINAARRAIRSASRKSKTRSTILNEDDVFKMFQQEDEEDDNMNNSKIDRHRASISYGYTTISGKSSTNNHSRYITDEMLERRANTIGRSYQVNNNNSNKSSQLENLFNTPIPKLNTTTSPPLLSPGNEKLEMAHPYFVSKNSNDSNESLPSPSPNKNINDSSSPLSNQTGSSKVAILDELLYKQNNSDSSLPNSYLQKRPSIAHINTETISSPSSSSNNNNNTFLDTPYSITPTSTTINNNNNRHRNSVASISRKTIQDRMDTFEGRSDQTSSTGHSRKSSGSAATMIRISQQQHSQTWSGRSPHMRGGIPQQQRHPNISSSSSPYDDDDENDGFREKNISPIPSSRQPQHYQGKNNNNNSTNDDDDDDDGLIHSKPPVFYTMRSKPKQRTGLPSWYSPSDDDIPTPSINRKTPAERERDEYLNTLYSNHRQ